MCPTAIPDDEQLIKQSGLLPRLRAVNLEFADKIHRSYHPSPAGGTVTAFVDLRSADDGGGALTGAVLGDPNGGLIACVAPASTGGRVFFLDGKAIRGAITLRAFGNAAEALSVMSIAAAADLDERAGQPISQAALSHIRAEYMLCCIAAFIAEAREAKQQTARFLIERKSATGHLIDIPDVRNQLSDVHAWLDILGAGYDHISKRLDAPTDWAEVETLLVATLRRLRQAANACVHLNGGWGYIERNRVAAFYRDLNAVYPLFRIGTYARAPELDWTQPLIVAEAEDGDFRTAFGDYLRTEVKPMFQAWQADRKIPRQGFERLGDRGFLGQACPREWGGGGAGVIRHMHMSEQMMLEDLVALSVSSMLIANTVVPILARYGSEDLKDRFLPAIASGRMIPCLAATESGSAGALVSTLATTAEDMGDHWSLSGNKHYITNSPVADVAFVLARTTRGTEPQGLTLLCVPMNLPGVTIEEKYAKLGAHASETGHIRFAEVKVPKKNIVGYVGSGLLYVVDVIVEERILIATAATSYALYCLNRTLVQLSGRTHVPALSDLRCEAATLRLRCWQTASRAAERKSVSTDAAMLKHLCGDFVRDCVDTCEEALLSAGQLPDEIAWLQRTRLDARLMSLFAGASGVMKDYYSRRVTAGLRLHSAS